MSLRCKFNPMGSNVNPLVSYTASDFSDYSYLHIVGSPTIENGLMSGFTTNDFAAFKNYGNKALQTFGRKFNSASSFDIQVKFKYSQSSSEQMLFSFGPGPLLSQNPQIIVGNDTVSEFPDALSISITPEGYLLIRILLEGNDGNCIYYRGITLYNSSTSLSTEIFNTVRVVYKNKYDVYLNNSVVSGNLYYKKCGSGGIMLTTAFYGHYSSTNDLPATNCIIDLNDSYVKLNT